MKNSFNVQLVKLLWIFLTFFITSTAFAENYKDVDPENDPAIDAFAIQDALNEIEPYGTIHLKAGNFDLGNNFIQIEKPCTLEGEKDLDGNLLTTINGESLYRPDDGYYKSIVDLLSGGVTIKNLIIENQGNGGNNIWVDSDGEEIIIENNILKNKGNEVGIYLWNCSCQKITIQNNEIFSHRGVAIQDCNSLIEIVGNKINCINDVPDWDQRYAYGIEITSYFDNPPANISNNVISLSGGCTMGIRVGHSRNGIYNCTVKDNTIKSLEGKSAFEGIGCYPKGENNIIINNDLSGLSTWGHQVSIAGKNNLLQGNIFGFANGDSPISGVNQSTAVSLMSAYFHSKDYCNEFGCLPRNVTAEYNTIKDNDYRNCGLTGWADDENGNTLGGCILVHAIPENEVENLGPPDEVKFNYIHETGRFPEGTGGPKTQILVIKSTNSEGTQLVHDNRIIGLSADELVKYKNKSNPKSGIIGISVEDMMRENITETENLIHLYPNPISDVLTIQTKEVEGYSFEIISLNGQVIHSKTFTGSFYQLDLSSFKTGIYFIKIKSKDFVTTRKISKI